MVEDTCSLNFCLNWLCIFLTITSVFFRDWGHVDDFPPLLPPHLSPSLSLLNVILRVLIFVLFQLSMKWRTNKTLRKSCSPETTLITKTEQQQGILFSLFVLFLPSAHCIFLCIKPVAQTVKNPPAVRDTWVRSDLWAGKILWRRAWQPTPVFLPGESPWAEEPGRLQSMGSQRVGHYRVTKHIY